MVILQIISIIRYNRENNYFMVNLWLKPCSWILAAHKTDNPSFHVTAVANMARFIVIFTFHGTSSLPSWRPCSVCWVRGCSSQNIGAQNCLYFALFTENWLSWLGKQHGTSQTQSKIHLSPLTNYCTILFWNMVPWGPPEGGWHWHSIHWVTDNWPIQSFWHEDVLPNADCQKES